MSMLERLSILLVGISVACGVWAVGNILFLFWQHWQKQQLHEAEMEIEEMLMQIPAAKLFHYCAIAATACALLVALIIGSTGKNGWNWHGAIIFGALTFIALILLPRFILRILRHRRLEKFNDQLEEALMSMSNALKAGFSITQAIEAVVRQKRQPISIEFRLMLQQTRLGMTLDDALFSMAKRVDSSDFQLVASAISTARITGGDLTGVFDRLAAMIRERMRIERRVRSLTAQGRLQSIVLGTLPMLLLFVLFLLDPQKIIHFFNNPVGILIFLVVLTLEITGFLVIRRIIHIDI